MVFVKSQRNPKVQSKPFRSIHIQEKFMKLKNIPDLKPIKYCT